MMREAPQATAELRTAARARPLPLWPDAWYVVARSADLAAGRVVDGEIGGRAYVLYRAASGAAVALDAHCPHMGTHLRTAQVVGDGLRCALHHWTIGSEGVLQGPAPCARYRSRAWPVAERFGLVFVHAGGGPVPAPPFVEESAERAEKADQQRDGQGDRHGDRNGDRNGDGEGDGEGDGQDGDFVWLTAKPLVLAADWRAVLVNGFDIAHLRAVHQRAVVGTPEVTRTTAGAVRMRYETRVLPGGGFSSWLTARLGGGRLRIAQTCFGPTMRVESRLGRFASRAVFGLVARDGKTHVYAAFGAPRSGLAAGLRLRLTRALYVAFLRKDYAVVEGMRLIVDGVADPGVRAIADYLRSLPELEVQAEAHGDR